MSDEATKGALQQTVNGRMGAEMVRRGALREVALLFLRLGFTAFGGPAAHIALMREEVVRRRRWISDQRFLDLLGLINLIPGPNSTELAIYLGYLRAGWLGLIIAGVCFIGPAMLIVLSLAWAYVTFGSTPQVGWLLYGIKPVIIAIIVQAIWGLSRTALRGVLPVIVALAILALYLLGVNELALLFGGALTFGLIRYGQHIMRSRGRRGSGGAATAASLLLTPASLLATMRASVAQMAQATRNTFIGMRATGATMAASTAATATATALAATATTYDPLTLFLTFLKIGAALYGSGYVILAFLQGDFVDRLHWLTERQLLDAVAIGQFTPGPVFTTATFIGYMVGGWQGALLATLAIFLPSFVYVGAIHPLATRLRRSPITATLLDGLNVAALALMAAVSLQLGLNALIDPLTILLGVASFAILLRFKPNSAWLVLGGALLGLLARSVKL